MHRKNDVHAYRFDQSIHTGVVVACFDAFCKTIKQNYSFALFADLTMV